MFVRLSVLSVKILTFASISNDIDFILRTSLHVDKTFAMTLCLVTFTRGEIKGYLLGAFKQ